MFQDLSRQFNSLYGQSEMKKTPLVTFQNLALQEFKKIDEQTQILQKLLAIKQQKQNSPTLSLQSVQDSFEQKLLMRNQSTISVFSLGYDLKNFSFSCQDRLKFGSQSNKILFQIKEKCSRQTYDYVSKVFEEKKKDAAEKRNFQKQKSHLDRVSQQNIILKKKLETVELEISSLQNKLKLKNSQRQEKCLKEKIQKQQTRLLKKQQALLYQQKLCKMMKVEIDTKLSELVKLNMKIDKNIPKSFKNGYLRKDEIEAVQNSLKQLTKCTEIQTNSIDEITKLSQKLQKVIQK